MSLRLENISHAYGDHRVFQDISVSVADGEIVCLLGPSGCGKTTLLRLAAGLETLQSGAINLGDRLVASESGQVPPEKRGVGLMFQDFALFPHLNVADNVAFGLSHLADDERRQRVDEVLSLVNLLRRKNDYPHTLSGGQQQRVALARALAPKPSVMLLDEPFSGLDQSMRIQIREENLGILKESGAATLLVTHNPDEAMFMADRILVMGPDGTILQEGTPNEIYGSPIHPFVASFFGQVNVLNGVSDKETVETPLGTLPVPGCEDGCEVDIVVRPHGIKLVEGGDDGIPVEIINARPLGRNTFVRFRVKGQSDGSPDYHCRQRGVFPRDPSQEIRVKLHPGRAFVFHRQSGGEPVAN